MAPPPEKPLLKTTFAPAKVIQPFYTGGKVALDRDGRLLATTLERHVLITDMQTGQELARIEGADEDDVTTLALTPQASHLIVCSQSYLMRIYALEVDLTADPPTVTYTQTRATKAHTAPVIVAETDPTGKFLATGGADGLVKVWDIKGGYVTHNFHGHGGVISALKFFAPPAGTALVVPAAEEPKKGKKSKKSKTTKEPGTSWMLASGADDTKIRVWDLLDSECVALLEGHSSVIRGLDWSASGKTLVSGSRDKTMCLWGARDWELKHTIAAFEEVEIVGFLEPGVLKSADAARPEQVMFAGGKRNRVRLWDVQTGAELTEDGVDAPEEESEEQGIADIIYHRNLPFLLSVHNDQTLLVHQLSLSSTSTSLPVVRRLSGHHDEIIDLAYLRPDSSLLALATNSEEIRIISLSDEHRFGDAGVLQGHNDIVICLDRDWSGTWLATGSKDNDARLWNVGADSFACHSTFTGHAESLGAIALPRSTPQEESATFKEQKPPKFIITGSQDRTIKKWDVYKKRAVYTRKAHEKDINAIDVSPDDTLFASASQDKSVKIWSVEDGETLGVLRGHRRGVWAVRFAPATVTAAAVGGAEGTKGGRMIVTGSGDKTVKLWSLSDYSCLKTFEGHTNSVLKTVWLSAGLQVATSGADGLVKVWDIKTGECSATLDNHESKVWALAARPDDHMLVSGGGDSVVTFWEDTTSTTLSATLAAESALVEQEQALQNYISSADYRSAITLALALNHPGRLLGLLTSVAATNEPASLCGVAAVDEVLGALSDSQLATLLCRVRDWNTNAKTAVVAQRVLYTLARMYPPERFVRMRPGVTKGFGSVDAVWDALGAYTERHYKRLEELVEESYIVEYTLREMEEILAEPEGMEVDVV